MDPLVKIMIAGSDHAVSTFVENLAPDKVDSFNYGRAAGLTDAMYIITMYMEELGVDEHDKLGDKLTTALERICDRMELAGAGKLKGIK